MSHTTNSILAEIVRAGRAFTLRRAEMDAITLRPKKPRVRGPLTSGAKDVLRTLTFQFANALTGLCHPSLATLAAATGCSKSSVKRHLPSLREAEYVEWRPGPWKRVLTRKGFRKVRSSNRYHLTCPNRYLSELHAFLTRVFRGRHGHLIKLVVSWFTPQNKEAKKDANDEAKADVKEAATIVETLARDLKPGATRTVSSPAPTGRPVSPTMVSDPPSQGPPRPETSAEIGGVQVADPKLASVLATLWTGLEQRGL